MEVKIISLSHEGRGIADSDGKKIFVDNALPDERVEIEITKKHRRYNEARVVNIIEASPYRITPRCQHFDICGGCQLQHINQSQQIQIKQKNLLDQLKYTGHVEPKEILSPLLGPEWGYRDKGRLSVKYVYKKEKLLIGFHEKNGRYVADISRCEVLNPKVGLNIELLKTVISSLSLYRHIPQIEVACDDNHCALIFRHMIDLPEADKKILEQFGKDHDFQIYFQPNDPPFDPRKDLSYTINTINFDFQPTDFTQINSAVNQKMVTLAIDLLDLKPDDNILDLFCGLGNFTLPLAKYCKHITGIEGDPQMIERAKKNAEKNNLKNTNFYCANLFEPNPGLTWIQKTYTKVLLDPPRTGALEILPFLNAPHIVYVSCNPATLARDAGELVNKYGYTLTKVGVMDMFPQTKHVESIAVFTRKL